MAQGEVIAKLNYLCSNIRHIEIFLNFFRGTLDDLWCADGEAHSPDWCQGVCTNIKWLLPILAEFKKKTYAEAKISYFAMEYFKGHLVAERLTDLYIWERPRGFYFFMS